MSNALFPLDGANPQKRRYLAPCDLRPFDEVMDAVRSNGGAATLLVLERAVAERALPPPFPPVVHI